MEPTTVRLTEAKNRDVSCQNLEEGKAGEVLSKEAKMNRLWELRYSNVAIVTNAACYT